MKVDIEKIANLSKLSISDSEKEKFEKQIENMIDMIENLPDISGKPFVDENNRMELRKDEVIESMERQKLLSNAPEVLAGCVAVPKTMES